MEQIDERQYDSESMKEEIKMDDRLIDSDKPVAREKLSIDIFPQSEFYMKRERKTECSDVVKTEVSSEMDIENVTTKKERVSPKWGKKNTFLDTVIEDLAKKNVCKIKIIIP